MTAVNWKDLEDAYIGPKIDVEREAHVVRVEEADGSVATSTRWEYREGRLEPYRDAFRALLRAAYEANLLRRQKLFLIVNKHTGETVDPFGPIDFRHYHPIQRPTLPELLASYTFHLRLHADDVLDYDPPVDPK